MLIGAMVLIGLGVGMLFDQTAAGVLIGLGLGLGAEAYRAARRRGEG